MRDEPDYTAQEDASFIEIDVADLVPRAVRADEIPELRSIYWRQAALGHRLPAERGVIVLEGGAK